MTAAAAARPRILVLGAGSAGTRHARHLVELGADVSITDPDEARATRAGVASTIPYDLERLDGYEGIVVASPSSFHVEQSVAALATGAHVLVEKPLGLDSQDLQPVLRADQGRLTVGYNLRLHAPVQRVAELVHGGAAGDLSAIRLWFGSWLPDWRPHVDYRTTYSARAALGGGILLDAIHELDVLVWLLGNGQADIVGAFVGRVGPLEIDVEDTVKALLRHSSGTVVDVSLDYLSRRYRRGIEVIGSEATIRLDWARQVIELEDAHAVTTTSADTAVAHSYRLEAEHFLAFIRGDSAPLVDGPTGAASVLLAQRIRAAGTAVP